MHVSVCGFGLGLGIMITLLAQLGGNETGQKTKRARRTQQQDINHMN